MTDRGFIERIAREAGEILSRHLGRLDRYERKGRRDLVTAADLEAEQHLVRRIRERHPSHAILAEETASSQGPAEHWWILDPLDGTTNFIYGIPHFAVSVAYWQGLEPVLGCVYNPVLDECFLAERGGGAFLGSRRLAVRRESDLGDALLATGFHYRRDEQPDSNLQHVTDLALQCRDLRRLGSAALDLCQVAMGRVDGYWELWLSPWDVAAGGLIASEAGASVTDRDGGTDWLLGQSLVAANPVLAGALRAALAAAPRASLPGPNWRPTIR